MTKVDAMPKQINANLKQFAIILNCVLLTHRINIDFYRKKITLNVVIIYLAITLTIERREYSLYDTVTFDTRHPAGV